MIAMLDDATGEIIECTLKHDGDTVREFYSGLSRPVVGGIGNWIDGMVF